MDLAQSYIIDGATDRNVYRTTQKLIDTNSKLEITCLFVFSFSRKWNANKSSKAWPLISWPSIFIMPNDKNQTLICVDLN